MMDRSIEYRSIIMRCDHVLTAAFRSLPDDVSFEFFEDGMEQVWIDVQRSAGEFADKSDTEVLAYFKDRFGSRKDLLKERCFFLKDHASGEYIGTCMAWESFKDSKPIPILHWLAVSDAYGGRGFARILITKVLEIFEAKCPGEPVYLHTQPSSFSAIKLYHDFGFNLCRKDTYGTAVNEYKDAVNVLKKVMKKDIYEEIVENSVD